MLRVRGGKGGGYRETPIPRGVATRIRTVGDVRDEPVDAMDVCEWGGWNDLETFLDTCAREGDAHPSRQYEQFDHLRKYSPVVEKMSVC